MVRHTYRMKTTTIAVTSKRQCVLPKDFCDRAGIAPNSRLRVTEINGGLYISPIPEPTEAEFRRVLKLSGGPSKARFTKAEEDRVNRIVKEVRAGKKHSGS
jgi:AbrB family looped-hinge helix DNA binding protein